LKTVETNGDYTATSGPEVALGAALRAFIDSLPRPFAFSRDASSRLRRIVVPKAGLFVVALDGTGSEALISVARAAAQTGTDGIAVSRHPSIPVACASILCCDRTERRGS
jgi:hypothetical protein